MNQGTKYAAYLLFGVAFIVFVAHLDVLLINIMEARNFITAREMILDGNWLLTTINGEPRYQKPPLPTWLTAFSALIFGLKNIAALRLPSAIMGLFTVMISYALALNYTRNKSYALWSGLILSTSFYMVFAGRNGQWDIFTHAFMMGGIYCLYQLFEQPKSRWRYALLTGLFFGASFMSKGPVSLYALFLPLVLAKAIVTGLRGVRSNLGPLVAVLIVGLVTALWWHGYINLADPENLKAITQKETSNWTGYNVKPFYYYWSFFIQSGLWTIPAVLSLAYPYLKSRVFNGKAYALSFWWTICAVLLLSLIPEKKPRYLLPVLIPLAFNVGFFVQYAMQQYQGMSRWLRAPLQLHFGLLTLVGLGFPAAAWIFFGAALQPYMQWFVLTSLGLSISGAAILYGLIKSRIQWSFQGSIAMIVVIVLFGMPIAPVVSQNPQYKPLRLLADWEEKNNIRVYEFGGFTPEMVWDFGKPIPSLLKDEVLLRPKDSIFGVIVSEDNLKAFQKRFQDDEIQLIERYDMNPQGPGERTHRPRLWRDFFVVHISSVKQQ
ncbi:MAG: glycosyltransferase family 39 protein [Bacteroidetes bacterium]|nr:glycosyltransferase family 39 protein [Bacteroidota bacterium]